MHQEQKRSCVGWSRSTDGRTHVPAFSVTNTCTEHGKGGRPGVAQSTVVTCLIRILSARTLVPSWIKRCASLQSPSSAFWFQQCCVETAVLVHMSFQLPPTLHVLLKIVRTKMWFCLTQRKMFQSDDHIFQLFVCFLFQWKNHWIIHCFACECQWLLRWWERKIEQIVFLLVQNFMHCASTWKSLHGCEWALHNFVLNQQKTSVDLLVSNHPTKRNCLSSWMSFRLDPPKWHEKIVLVHWFVSRHDQIWKIPNATFQCKMFKMSTQHVFFNTCCKLCFQKTMD